MKNNSKVIISIIWVSSLICATLLGCIFSGFFVISDIETNGNAFGNWAMWFGSFFGAIAACGALFAANFTRKTLKFLTKQHDEQQVLQKIQMYKEHKTTFNAVLDDLELNYKGRFVIERRATLYQAIFPKNNFLNVDTQASSDIHNIKEAIRLYEQLIKLCYEPPSHQNLFDRGELAINLIHHLLYLLNIKMSNNNKSGDIVYTGHNTIRTEDYYLLNVFECQTTVDIITDVLKHLLIFTCNDPSNELSPFKGNVTSPIQAYVDSKFFHNRYYLTPAKLRKGLIEDLFNLWSIIKSIHIKDVYQDERLFHNQLRYLIHNYNSFDATFNHDEKARPFLDLLIRIVPIYMKETPDSYCKDVLQELLTRFKEDHFKIISNVS